MARAASGAGASAPRPLLALDLDRTAVGSQGQPNCSPYTLSLLRRDFDGMIVMLTARYCDVPLYQLYFASCFLSQLESAIETAIHTNDPTPLKALQPPVAGDVIEEHALAPLIRHWQAMITSIDASTADLATELHWVSQTQERIKHALTALREHLHLPSIGLLRTRWHDPTDLLASDTIITLLTTGSADRDSIRAAVIAEHTRIKKPAIELTLYPACHRPPMARVLARQGLVPDTSMPLMCTQAGGKDEGILRIFQSKQAAALGLVVPDKRAADGSDSGKPASVTGILDDDETQCGLVLDLNRVYGDGKHFHVGWIEGGIADSMSAAERHVFFAECLIAVLTSMGIDVPHLRAGLEDGSIAAAAERFMSADSDRLFRVKHTTAPRLWREADLRVSKKYADDGKLERVTTENPLHVAGVADKFTS